MVDINTLSESQAAKILDLLKSKHPELLSRKSTRKKKVEKQKLPAKKPERIWAASSVQKHAINTTSYYNVAKFFIGEIIPDIENRSMPSIKSSVVEILELLAELSPHSAKKLRRKAAMLVLIDNRNKLISDVCTFAASLKLKS